ncbi:MAG: type IV pilus assembly protein PilM [Candidatus Rokubacteria bacterium]|nr:type IV pilus assembly protein PilM [Candidatus Rokubacteria bacterium]
MALFGKRKAHVIGVDIGSSAVKVVELKRAGSGYQLAAFGMAEVPLGAIEGGEIREPGAVQAAIGSALADSKTDATDAVIGVSGGSVIAKRVKLPKMSEAELAESIRWEAEQYIPFDIDDVNLDFQIVAGGGPQIDVMLAAVKKGKVESYAEVAKAAGLNVVVVDADVFALETQYEHNYAGETNEVVAIVNIGHENTNTNILQGGVSVYARDIFMGGARYASSIAQRFNLPLPEAEAVLRGKEGSVAWAQVGPVLELVSQELGQEIQRTLDYFGTTAEHERLDRIFLSGGCALIPGLRDFLSSQWGIDVSLADPFRQVKIAAPGVSPDEIQRVAPLATVATGLAMRSPDDRR